MTEARRTLTVRDEARRSDAPSQPGRGWGISVSRLDNLHEYARQMRRNPTDAEKQLWAHLKDQQLGGFKFRRKQVVGSAIVDFACPARWLVVDLDGENPAIDALRDRKLTDVGIRVMRFTKEAVTEDLDGVLQAILVELQKPFDRKRAARSHPASRIRGESSEAGSAS